MENNISQNITKINKSITDLDDNSILINLTFPNDNKFLGKTINNPTKVRLPFSVGDISSFEVENKIIYNCMIKNFNAQNVSYSRYSDIFQKLKSSLDLLYKDKEFISLYFSYSNLSSLHLNRIYKALNNIFENSRYCILICSEDNDSVKINQLYQSMTNKIKTRSPIVQCKINNSITAALLDSGAEASVIDENFARHCNLKIFNHVRSNRLRGVSGNNLNVVGTTSCSISFGKINFTCNFYVVKDCALGVPILLGTDSLKEASFLIDFKNSIIWCDGHRLDWLKADSEILQEDKTIKLINKSDFEIPALSKKVLELHVHNISNSSFIFNYIYEQFLKLNLTIPQSNCNALFPITDNKIFLEVHNNSNKNVKLAKGLNVANISIINSVSSISNFDSNISSINHMHKKT